MNVEESGIGGGSGRGRGNGNGLNEEEGVMQEKYLIILKGFFLIALVFVFNFFLDILNAADWILFSVGLVGLVLTAILFVGTIVFKHKGGKG